MTIYVVFSGQCDTWVFDRAFRLEKQAKEYVIDQRQQGFSCYYEEYVPA